MNSFNTRKTFTCCDRDYTYFSLPELEKQGYKVGRLPYSLRLLLENLLRHERPGIVRPEDIEAMANWRAKDEPTKEISYTPARVLLQDFTGVPCVVDLAAMREAMARLGGDPRKINPLQPVELVIDHSVQVDAYGSEAAEQINRDLEFERNRERYEFLRWGQKAFDNFKVVPPNTGIVHQVNLEYLARVVFVNEDGGGRVAYPDTLVGTDSHTTMINGLGVLGWGVGGIEAEAAMLGQPVSMLIPQVVGFRMVGELPEGSTATDLVLTVTEMLRKHGVVGKFVEFYGPGVHTLPLADRATIGNMSPEYGATCGIFPVDNETLNYLRMTDRPEEHVRLVETYMKEQGLFYGEDAAEPEFSERLELDLSTVEPSVAGPRRPQDRVRLSEARKSFFEIFGEQISSRSKADRTAAPAAQEGAGVAVLEKAESVADDLTDGSVVIAAITSCTNTSNAALMIAAGLVARKAVERGIKPKPWVKTSTAPGSRVVTSFLEESGLLRFMEDINFHIVGYGCTTCIGNSGPLPDEISQAVQERDLAVVSVLSGNRNFEGRINPDVKANYLMSPPLVVIYALAGTIDIDLTKDPIATDQLGQPVFLKDLWPTRHEVANMVQKYVRSDQFRKSYDDVYKGDEAWRSLPTPESDIYEWSETSTYIKNPPYFDDMKLEVPSRVRQIHGAQVLALLGDSVTTDHISPAGAIKVASPAGQYLLDHEVRPHMFNSYGSRRGNHEVMMRGTFANIRLRNRLAPGTEGGFTTYLPTGEVTTIYEAAVRYADEQIPTLVIAGKEYGSGSSRDWAAKGPNLLGVNAVIAESYERIHRSNLVGMGIAPLQFMRGESAETLGLTGHERFDILNLPEIIAEPFAAGRKIKVRATDDKKKCKEFEVFLRIDTPQELQYYRHGGILHYVLRQLASKS
jgi:aconitate hydratase